MLKIWYPPGFDPRAVQPSYAVPDPSLWDFIILILQVSDVNVVKLLRYMPEDLNPATVL
jgi:hypothetical protein